MELRLFILLLLTGVVPIVSSIFRKYYLIQQSKTWTEAQTYCRSEHTDLATIETAEEMNRLQTEAQKHQFSSSAWVGLYNDVNSWRWSMGNQPVGSFTDWYLTFSPPAPNNLDGHEECGRTNNAGWADSDCSLQSAFICFDERLTGTDRYILYSNLKSWPEAQAFCREFHTDLASARDSTENSMIQGKVSGFVWFGLSRESWKWSDRTSTSTISWKPGQPNNAQVHEDCGEMTNGQVSDILCSETKPFFCYREITGQQQIIKIKLRSDQDVNDPAVKAAILEQINQKLKGHGMQNVTVKWREQPDGKVFHKTNEENGTSAESTSSSKCEV